MSHSFAGHLASLSWLSVASERVESRRDTDGLREETVAEGTQRGNNGSLRSGRAVVAGGEVRDLVLLAELAGLQLRPPHCVGNRISPLFSCEIAARGCDWQRTGLPRLLTSRRQLPPK